MLKFLAGAAVGAAIAGGAVYALWEGDKRERIASYAELSDSYSALQAHPAQAAEPAAKVDVPAIKRCMFLSNMRSQAILQRAAGQALSDIEKGVLREFSAILAANPDASQTKLTVLLSEEARKLDGECLAGALG